MDFNDVVSEFRTVYAFTFDLKRQNDNNKYIERNRIKNAAAPMTATSFHGSSSPDGQH